mgnify:CR=1 FL=1
MIIGGRIDEKEIMEYPVDRLRFKRRYRKDKMDVSDAELKELEKLEKQDAGVTYDMMYDSGAEIVSALLGDEFRAHLRMEQNAGGYQGGNAGGYQPAPSVAPQAPAIDTASSVYDEDIPF